MNSIPAKSLAIPANQSIQETETLRYMHNKIKKKIQTGVQVEYIKVTPSKENHGKFSKIEQVEPPKEPYIPYYYSSENSLCLNGVAEREINHQKETIWCRHLADSYVYNYEKVGIGKGYFEKINNKQKIKKAKFISDNQAVKEHSYTKCSSEAYYFLLEDFPKVLVKIVYANWELPDKTKKYYYFKTTTHTMALRIKKVDDALKINFYDPNQTLRHKTFIISQPYYASSISINHMLTHDEIAHYFSIQPPSGCLLSKELATQRDDCSVYYFGSFHHVLFHHAMNNGHYGHRNLPTLNCASTSHLSRNDRIKLLQACDSFEVPALFRALQFNRTEAIQSYVAHIAAIDYLELIDLIKLLRAYSPIDKQPALFGAIEDDNPDAIRAYLSSILNIRKLTQASNHLVKLLAARYKDEMGLHWAKRKSKVEVIKAFLEVFLQTDHLSVNDKLHFLHSSGLKVPKNPDK